MKVIDCEQGSEQWLDLHRGRPTASVFKRIVTPKQWKYATGADSLINELIHSHYTGDLGSDILTPDMVNGVLREDEARRYYEFDKGEAVEQVGFCMTDDERFGASPDGFVGDDGGIELKNPKATTHLGWLREGGVPAEHLPQVHGCLWVTGRKWWDFMSYCLPYPTILVRVEWDEKTKLLGEHLEKFWEKYQAARDIVGKKMEAPLPTKTVILGGEPVEMTPLQESYF